jgi:NDP-sugar pyrophosphorylase family protein
VKALLLVGGEGTRLRAVLDSAPKPLALVGGRPFLELLVRQLESQGIRDLVLCTGYRAEQIEKIFGNGRRMNVSIAYSREPRPLGTAGALKLARHHLEGESEFLLLNGDSFLELSFGPMIAFHRAHGGVATIASVPVSDTSRYGTLEIGAQGRVRGFREKSGDKGPGFINAGVYVFSSGILERIPEGPASLERDVLPQALDLGIYALEQPGIFIDIGTPADYARAQNLYRQILQAVIRSESAAPAHSS